MWKDRSKSPQFNLHCTSTEMNQFSLQSFSRTFTDPPLDKFKLAVISVWNCTEWKLSFSESFIERIAATLGPPLQRWHAGDVPDLSRLCAQAAGLQGQTAPLCVFMAEFTTRKWSFPGLWRQWRGWIGTREGSFAQYEMFKTAKRY